MSGESFSRRSQYARTVPPVAQPRCHSTCPPFQRLSTASRKLVSCESCRSQNRPFDFGKNFREGGCRPAKRMSGSVPFGDEALDLALKFFEVRKIGSGESFPLKNREPLLDLIHPRTVNGREVKAESRMLGEPCLNLLTLVHDQVVADNMNDRD